MTKESITGIIFNTDRTKVLLIKRRDVPVWVLPGGGLEANETPEQGVIRELEEETGYKVKVKKKIAEYSPLCSLAKFTHYFECAILSGSPILGDETKEIAFFPFDHLPYRIPPPYPDWIRDALSSSKLIKKSISSITYRALFRHLLRHPLLIARCLLTKIGMTINSKELTINILY